MTSDNIYLCIKKYTKRSFKTQLEAVKSVFSLDYQITNVAVSLISLFLIFDVLENVSLLSCRES